MMMRSAMYYFGILVLCMLMKGSVQGTPGCSFKEGNCTYDIKLGHQGECDKGGQQSQITASSESCCTDIRRKYAALQDDMEEMKMKVDFALSVLNTTANMIAISEFEEVLRKHDDILAVLERREKELNETKDELAKTINIAAKEIKSLRDNLATMDIALTSCQTELAEQRLITMKTETTTLATTTTESPRVHLTPRDYTTKYCSFDNDMCGFKTSSADIYILLVKMNKGSSSLTGPSVEHSMGISAGYYLGLYSKYTALNRPYDNGEQVKAKSQSMLYPAASAYCVMFWNYMRGADVKTLTVNLETMDGNSHTLYNKTGPSETDEWELAKIDVPEKYASKGFKIDFTMSTDASYKFKEGIQHLINQHGDIAVDDLYVMDTACDNVLSYSDGAYRRRANNTVTYYTFHTNPLSWFEAFDFCRSLGPLSALVSIDSDDEQEYLVTTIQGSAELNQQTSQDGFYTSGTDIDQIGSFVWTNTGIPRTVGQGHWYTNQPDKRGSQNCLLLDNSHNYKWGDVNCKTRQAFICEATYLD